MKSLLSPGTLGSERFSGILHWSTWSFRAFTSSMSPGTLGIKHVSYTQLPQEGPLPLPSHSLHALWQIHYKWTPNWLQMGFGDWKYSVLCLRYLCRTKQNQSKHNGTKQPSGKSLCRSMISQGDPRILLFLVKRKPFLNKSRCYRVRFSRESPTQTHSCGAPTCL